MSESNSKNASVPAPPKAVEPTHSGRSSSWERFKRNRPALFSLWFLVGLLVLVAGWPLVLKTASFIGPNGAAFAQRHDPDKLSDEQFKAPNASHWFGTDVHGRDLFSRVVYGARVSLLAGIIATGVSLLIGVLWGAVAGYVGGRVDALLMRFVDVLYSLPSIIFVIVLITTLESVVKNWLAALGVSWVGLTRFLFLLVGLGAVSWLTMARLVRGQVLSLRHRSFVEASQVLGAGPGHILAHHIIPHTYGIVIVYLTLTVPGIMLYESFLSYLGLGIQPPMASWGSLIAEGADQINPIRTYWWLIVFPGGFLISTLLALNFVGDGLRDVWGSEAKEGRA
jgi:oligopeptide transport system permease protein